MGSGGISIISFCYFGDGEVWGIVIIGRFRGFLKVNLGFKFYLFFLVWEKGELEWRGCSVMGRVKELFFWVIEIREVRG